MFDATAPDHPNPVPAPGLDAGIALRLTADAYRHLIQTLRLALPPPPGETPDDVLRRDHAAIASIAALCPANAAEADLAAQFVAASEQWKHCLRLALQPETSQEWATKCRAQALGMMRQANAALRLLLRLQQTRRKLESDAASCDRRAWTEHCAMRLMAEALPPSEPPPAASEAAEPIRDTDTRATRQAQSEPVAPDQPRTSAAVERPITGAAFPKREPIERIRPERSPADSLACPDDDLVPALIAARSVGSAAVAEARAA